MEGFWDSCLSKLEKELPAQQFKTWILPLKLDLEQGVPGELHVLAPNRFVLQWVKERFATRIEHIGAEFFSSPIKLTLGLEPAKTSPATSPEPKPAVEPSLETKTAEPVTRPAPPDKASLIEIGRAHV